MPRRYGRDRRDMRRRMRDRARRRSRRVDMASRRRYGDRERHGRYGTSIYSEPDYARGGRRSEQRRQRDRHWGSPYEIRGEFNYEYDPYEEDYRRGYDRRGMDYGYDYRGDYRGNYGYGMDYDDGEDYLDDEELMEWAKELMEEVEAKDKPFFTEQNIKSKAQMMGIPFEDFTFEELFVTALMQYTDYKDVIGTGNLDHYILMAKAWLCDEDSELQYGEKLAAYKESVVDGE